MPVQFTHPHTLMVQGCTSDAGKSIVVAALCRILKQQGIAVAPFKPQNMALNSAVSAEGGEIGRAQAMQADACGLPASVMMNPILLKPNSDTGSQVIVFGKAIGNMNAVTYHQYKPQLLQQVLDAHQQLSQQYQLVCVEGAGSPAEINLREHDIANMGFAEAADCPVIIVADIDRGGVFAHLYGTFALLSKSEQQRVKGFIINRFRGDVALLQSGLDWLQYKTGVTVLGFKKFIKNLQIEAEDSLNVSQSIKKQQVLLKVAVILYPRASNFTDLDALNLHPNIQVQFYKQFDEQCQADLIILPGSKSVRGDLAWLQQQGWADKIKQHLRYGGQVFAICGGYQMLGKCIDDPLGIESAPGSSAGLGLLPIHTTLTAEKTLRNVRAQLLPPSNSLSSNAPSCEDKKDRYRELAGYEIHCGQTQIEKEHDCQALFKVTYQQDSYFDGWVDASGQIMGSYLHGCFDQLDWFEHLFLKTKSSELSQFDYQQFRQQEFDRLASVVEQALGLDTIKALFAYSAEGDPRC